jgi:hypothetical protein
MKTMAFETSCGYSVVWCGVCVCKTTGNVYLIASDVSQFVPLSENSKVLLSFILLTC